MTMNRAMILALLLCLTGCNDGKGPAPGQRATDYYDVTFLFERDGCRLYRFDDGPHYHYFASCPGSTSSRVSAGKTSRPDEVITGVPGL